jgi:hypothetical protein
MRPVDQMLGLVNQNPLDCRQLALGEHPYGLRGSRGTQQIADRQSSGRHQRQ